MNSVTQRLFVAATKQNDGKTTVSLGLFGALRKRLGRIGFIKPVGQRFVEVDGRRIDEDSVLIDQTFGVQTPLEAMSPIAVEPDLRGATSSIPTTSISSGTFRIRSTARLGKRNSSSSQARATRASGAFSTSRTRGSRSCWKPKSSSSRAAASASRSTKSR